jgi:hypothetical protein
MTSRRSRPRRSSGSSAGAFALGVLLLAALTAGAPRAETEALVERRDGVEIDWAEGTVTASGGAAADLRMPSADVARAGAVRRAEAAARERLAVALAALPLGGGRKPAPDDVQRALGRARLSQSDFQSNGGAVVRVTARFADWLEGPPASAVVLSVAAAHLAAAPIVKIAGRDVTVGAASYRLGAPPRDAKALAAKVDRAGRLAIEGAHKDSDLVQKLARGTALIYVEKVLR